MEDPVQISEVATPETVETESTHEVEKIEEDESTNDVPASPAPVSSRRETYNKNAYIMLDVNHRKVEPADVIEYEWPIKSGDRWFIQEQIGELLDIKSFSRKFPDLTRRKVNHEERGHLENYFSIHKLLNETQLRDMNAMRSSEIHDLMNSVYPEIYQEYKKIIAQREREIAHAKAKEMEAIKNDSVKLAELRKKALKSASDFNKDLQNSRRSERRQFWDIQTNIIQSKLSDWKKMSKEASRPSPYPVALIPGQYQQFYKKYTQQELLRLPFGTVIDSDYLYPLKREPSPPPLSIAEQDLIRLEREEAKERAEQAKAEVEKKPTAPAAKLCESCGEGEGEDDDILSCATCGISYHPTCIEMPERMASIVRTYQWSCVDCRLCSICNKPDKEDEIVFCDKCDRGFHTYCVGMKQPPKGTWFCAAFCGQEVKPKGRPRKSVAQAEPAAKAKTPEAVETNGK